jgi:CCR4-NOT transcription complex subunit 2
MNPQLSFSNIASGSNLRKNLLPTGDDFPALGVHTSRQGPTREEILMSNLLGPKQPFTIAPQKGNAQKAEKQEDKFGLLGLKEVIRMSNPDLSMLSLGVDLTSLGLDLNSNDNVYSNFMTPFTDTPSQGADPTFPNTASYKMSKQLPDSLSKFSSFDEETLLYIFYSMPRDRLQEAAAQELYMKRWRFHKEFKLWLTKENFDTEPLVKGVDFERDIYVFFDPSTWTRVKKEWILYFDQIEERSGDLGEQGSSWISTGSIFDLPRPSVKQMAKDVGKMRVTKLKNKTMII